MFGESARRSLRLFAAWSLTTAVGALNSPAEDTPDYSDGFRQLIALGLPEIGPDARWVAHGPTADRLSYATRELIGGLKGNCWALPADGNDDQAYLLPIGGLETVGIPASRLPKDAVDLEKDVEALVSILQGGDPDKADELRMFSRSFSRSEDANDGNLLVFAAQLHQTGHPALANRLATALFSQTGSVESAIDSAISQMASIAYQEIVSAFFENPDFAAYHAALADLTKRFPRGWSNAPALAMMMPHLEKQAGSGPLPQPRIEGIELDPEAVAAVSAWQEPESGSGSRRDARMMAQHGWMLGHGHYMPFLWLLPDGDDSESAGGPHSAIIRHGMKSIPVLAALADDPYFTVIPNTGGRSTFWSSRESEEQRILRAYQSMNRPATRGEIARQLLAATLPDPTGDLNQADADTLRHTALEFWKKHRDDDAGELTLVFLREGSEQQAVHAANRLASSTDPAAHAAFEKHVLAADNPAAFYGAVGAYLRVRRVEGAEFLESYAIRVREFAQQAADQIERSWEIRNAGGLEKALRTLQGLVSPETPRTIARNIAREDPDEAETAIAALLTLIEDSDPTERIEILLDGASVTRSPLTRCHFLAAIFRINWSGILDDTDDPDEEEDEETAPPPRAISGSESILWRRLLADSRPIPDEFQNRIDLGREPTIGLLAGSAAEYSFAPYEAITLQVLAPVIGKPLGEYLHERASARISGDPIPPVPDASSVSDDRLREIVAEAAGRPAGEIRAFIDSLTVDERAKWAEWYSEPEDPPLPPEFLKMRNRIMSPGSGPLPGIPDTPGVLGLEPGFTITAASLQEHLESQAAALAAHSPGMVFIHSSRIHPGLEINSIRMEPPEPEAEDNGGDDSTPSSPHRMNSSQQQLSFVFQRHVETMEGNPEIEGIVSAILGSGHGGVSSTWWLRDGKLVRPDGVAGGDRWGAEENPESFGELLENLTQSGEMERFTIRIECLVREHLSYFNTNNQ